MANPFDELLEAQPKPGNPFDNLEGTEVKTEPPSGGISTFAGPGGAATLLQAPGAILGGLLKAGKQSATEEFARSAGGTFDPEGEPAGDATFAFKVGRNMEQGGLTAARDAFEKQFPKGDLIKKDFTGYGSLLLYREDKDKPFKLFGHDTAFTAGEHLNARNVVSLLAGAVTGGVSIPTAMVTTSIGAAGGQLIDNFIQGLSKSENLEGPEGRGEQLKRVFSAGAINAAGVGALGAGAAGAGAVKSAVNNFTSGALRRLSPEVNSFITAIDQEGLPPLGVGQVSDRPIVRVMTRQAATTSPVLSRMTRDQLAAVEQKLVNLAAEGKDLTAGDLRLLDDVRKSMLVRELGDVVKMDRSEAGQVVQQSLSKYELSSKAINDKQYNALRMNARDEDMQFDAGPIIQTAAEIEQGVLAPSQRRMANWAPMLDDNGNVITGTFRIGSPSAEIRPFIDKIKSLGQVLKNVESEAIETSSGLSEPRISSAVEQLQALRSGLFDLMHSENATTRRQATALWNATAEVMENPTKASARSRALLGVANEFNAEREKTLLPIRRMIDKEDPGNLAAGLVKPGNYQTLINVRNVFAGSEDQAGWKAIQDGFKSDLLADPEKIITKLDRFSNDQRTLNLIVTPKEQQLFRELGAQHKRWATGPVADIIKGRQIDVTNAVHLAFKGSPDELTTILNAADSVGKKDSMVTDVRAGIYQWILDQSLATSEKALLSPAARSAAPVTEGRWMSAAARERAETVQKALGNMVERGDVIPSGKMVDARAMVEAIDFLEKSPMKARLDNFLGPKDWERLRTMANYVANIEGIQGSAGSAIGAAAQVSMFKSGIKAAEDPGKWVMTVLGFFNNETIARMMARPATATAVENAINEGPTKAGIRSLLGASLGAYADTMTHRRD